MKKLVTLALTAALVFSCLAGCGSKKEPVAEDGKLSVITTIFPQYDFTRQIAGDKANVRMLLPPGAESHSYEPSPQDIISIQSCDLFIYVGGESDTWVESIIESMGEDAPRTLTLFECVDAVEEVVVEGMQAEEEEHEGGEPELDEHVWTSPKNAVLIAGKIAAVLSELDTANEYVYAENAKAYTAKLNELDSTFESVMADAARKCIVIGDRFPFRYMADAYGIEYYAAFPGCSTESEPSAATVMYLTDKVKDEGIPVVFYIEFSNHKVADVIAEATGAKTLMLHSCHNVTQDELDSGITYVELMTRNAENLREALS